MAMEIGYAPGNVTFPMNHLVLKWLPEWGGAGWMPIKGLERGTDAVVVTIPNEKTNLGADMRNDKKVYNNVNTP